MGARFRLPSPFKFIPVYEEQGEDTNGGKQEIGLILLNVPIPSYDYSEVVIKSSVIALENLS